MHIRISLGSKFKLQQTISIFWNKFPENDTFGQEQIKWTSPMNSGYSN